MGKGADMAERQRGAETGTVTVRGQAAHNPASEHAAIACTRDANRDRQTKDAERQRDKQEQRGRGKKRQRAAERGRHGRGSHWERTWTPVA